MNNEYLARAKQNIPDSKALIVVASRRARNLAYGARPMVRCKEDNFIDVALLEIAEGCLGVTTECGEGNSFLKEMDAARRPAKQEENK